MGKVQRVMSVLGGVLMILGALAMMMIPDIGYQIVILIFAFSLLISGLRELMYYFSMTRHMVGGRMTLFYAIIRLDLAVFLLSLYSLPRFYVFLFLIASFAFEGAIDIARGFEAKKYGTPSWRGKVASGIVNLMFVLICTIFIQSNAVLIWIYGIGLIWSGIVRIANAFRRTAIIYIA